jgi:hypothetical protein
VSREISCRITTNSLWHVRVERESELRERMLTFASTHIFKGLSKSLSLSLPVVSDSNPFPTGVSEILSELAKFCEKSECILRTQRLQFDAEDC